MGIENIQQRIYASATAEGGIQTSTDFDDLKGPCWEWHLQGPHFIVAPSVALSAEQFACWLSDLETDGFCLSDAVALGSQAS